MENKYVYVVWGYTSICDWFMGSNAEDLYEFDKEVEMFDDYDKAKEKYLDLMKEGIYEFSTYVHNDSASSLNKKIYNNMIIADEDDHTYQFSLSPQQVLDDDTDCIYFKIEPYKWDEEEDEPYLPKVYLGRIKIN